ncbi:DUF3486 family protein [Patescibacteria group bacterium]|nr:DUF3486 family protein [Patescibacteria group bacterium]
MKQRSRSWLLKLPREILSQINQMLVEVGEKRKTYQEIADWVNEQGHKTSQSAIDRYAKNFFALEKIKLVGEQARTIISASGDDPLKIEEAASKLGAVIVLELFQEVMREDTINPKRIGKLMGDFARLQTSSVARERLKIELAKKAQAAVDRIKTKGRLSGLTEENIKQIEKEIFGLVR